VHLQVKQYIVVGNKHLGIVTELECVKVLVLVITVDHTNLILVDVMQQDTAILTVTMHLNVNKTQIVTVKHRVVVMATNFTDTQPMVHA